MSILALIISTVVTGLIVGALGRLALPGPNPMSVGMTIAVGIGGAFVGGVIGSVIGAGAWVIIILQVLATAGIIYFMERRRGTAR